MEIAHGKEGVGVRRLDSFSYGVFGESEQLN